MTMTNFIPKLLPMPRKLLLKLIKKLKLLNYVVFGQVKT